MPKRYRIELSLTDDKGKRVDDSAFELEFEDDDDAKKALRRKVEAAKKA
jgi:hypothetical protein